MKFTLSLLLVLISSFSYANGPEYLDLEGSMFIWGDHLPDGKNQDLDGLSIFITGKAAERLYKKMKAKPIYDGCLGDGTYFKSQGVFSCKISPKSTYSCDFGISTKKRKVYGGESC